MVPLHICGKIEMEGLNLDMDHYYHIQEDTGIKIPEGGKLVIILLSDFIWSS
jgi:hypothetical protein